MDAYIVYGSKLDTLERLVLDSLTSEALFQSRVEVSFGGKNITKELKINKILVQDNETDLDRLRTGTTMIILVGSRTHNSITAEVYDAGYITNESLKYRDQLIIGKGNVDTDSNVMVVYHKVVGDGVRLEREAVKYSPLSDFMPEAYVPVVATGIGMLLLHFFNIFKTIAEFLTLKLGRKKKTFGYTGPQIKGIHLKEIGAILGASFVLGFAVTWTFTGPSMKFFDLIFLNAGICLFAALSHELTHRIIGRFFGIKMEYRFWYGGSLITILTAFLGNSFGIQGFLLEKGDDNISTWKYGVTKLAAPVVSMFIAMAFAVLYLKNPGVIFQMVYTTASIWAMAEIFPVEGLDGYDVKKWNRLVCFIFLILISIVFFAINFIQ